MVSSPWSTRPVKGILFNRLLCSVIVLHHLLGIIPGYLLQYFTVILLQVNVEICDQL